MDQSAGRTELLERERRWRKPAAIAAILGALGIQAGFVVNGTALDGDGTAERLLEASAHDADGQLLLGLCIAAGAFVLLIAPLVFLFRAAQARSPRVLGPLLPLLVIGPLLVAAGLVATDSAYLNAADDFAAAEAERSPGAEQAPEVDAGDDEEEADDRAQDAISDADGAGLAEALIRSGALALAIGLVYTALWCMRTGLLTRFWGSLGVASAVVFGLFTLPLVFFIQVWFLAMGLFLLGAWFGGRPSAWETGTAVPWPRPGEQPDGAPGDDTAIEGEGRELGGGEGESPQEPPGDPGSGRGEPPRKRKRRR